MNRLFWPGLLCLSASWLFFIPQFTLPDAPVGGILVLLGVLCLIAAVGTPSRQPQKATSLLGCLPLLIALVILPFPFTIGLLVLLLGLLVAPLISRWSLPQAIPTGLLLAGVILVLQSAMIPLYTVFVSHGHRVDILAPVLSALGGFLGLHTSSSSGLLFIQTVQGTTPVVITWESLGFYLWVNLFLGTLLLFCLLTERHKMLRNLLIVLAASIPYLLLRFIMVLSGYVVTKELSIFWDPLLMTVSFLPFALLMMKLLPLHDIGVTPSLLPTFSFTKKHLVTTVVAFLFFLCIVSASCFHDPGTMKTGGVLIDEYHSQWEDTTRPMNTTWYGLLSTYNYYSWAQFLEYYYTVETNIDAPITPGLLASYDILILKCPTQAYTTAEVAAITQFVHEGGGVYLIGDHTNVFGMNTFLNQVSEQFGMRFNTDATYELGTGDLSVYQPADLCMHPITAHLSQLEFMTSCTLTPTSLLSSLTMENIVIGNRLSSEPGTYATENFFRESLGSLDSMYGYFVQAAAVRYGDGRVVAFTDSTVFSSFSLFTDGYPAFTLGVLDYLNRTNSSVSLNLFFFSMAMLCLLGIGLLFRTITRTTILWVLLLTGVLGCAVAAPLFTALTTMTYPAPSPHTDYTQVCFKQEHSRFNISVKPSAIQVSLDENYGTFYVWTQRLGCVPSMVSTFDEAVEQGDIIVIINPTCSFTEQETARITTYLESGGKLLLLDSIMNTKSTANELTSTYGIWISTTAEDQPLIPMLDNQTSLQASIGNITAPYLTITGGTPLLRGANNSTFASVVHIVNDTTGRQGMLLVVVDAYTFSDAAMGGLFTEPTAQQQARYDLEFYLFSQLLT